MKGSDKNVLFHIVKQKTSCYNTIKYTKNHTLLSKKTKRKLPLPAYVGIRRHNRYGYEKISPPALLLTALLLTPSCGETQTQDSTAISTDTVETILPESEQKQTAVPEETDQSVLASWDIRNLTKRDDVINILENRRGRLN